MRRVIAAAGAAMLLAAVGLPAQAATSEAAQDCGTWVQTGDGGWKFVAKSCGRDGSTPGGGGDSSPGNGGGGGGNSDGGESSEPRRRTVSREVYNEMMQRCIVDGDALSIQCMANLPQVAEPGQPPAGVPPLVVEDVQEFAIAQLSTTAPEIGASPCQSTANACRGTVGVPVWLWVGDGTGSLPSDSVSVTAGPFTIDATAKVSKVKWSLGDGQTTFCSGTGTAFDAAKHGWSNPDCGFDNGWKQPGTYTLTASYVWEISWSGDQTGTATETVSSTEQVTVGELQSVASQG